MSTLKKSSIDISHTNKKIAFYLDFDGTITNNDTLNHLLEKHASNEWILLDELYLKGELSSSECIKKQVNLLKNIPTKLLLSSADEVVVDATFRNFFDLCKANKIKVEILSDGLDFYIKHLLEKAGIDLRTIKIRSNKYLGNGNVSFQYKKKLCDIRCGNCKPIHLNNDVYKIYVGDGKSDECVAQKCDLIFAKGRLSKFLSNKKINYIHFDNFNDIIKKLPDLIGQ